VIGNVFTHVSAPVSGSLNGFNEFSFVRGAGLGPKELAGKQAFFDGVPGTPLMVSNKQINAIVPYEVSGNANVMVQVAYQGGVKSNDEPVSVSDSAPALFTSDLSRKGQGAILNRDYKLNAALTPPLRLGCDALR